MPPDRPAAFQNAEKVKGKTSYAGGIRRRWRDVDGSLLEWDYQHGRVERYNARGIHLGEYDPVTGEQVSGPNKTRNVKP